MKLKQEIQLFFYYQIIKNTLLMILMEKLNILKKVKLKKLNIQIYIQKIKYFIYYVK